MTRFLLFRVALVALACPLTTLPSYGQRQKAAVAPGQQKLSSSAQSVSAPHALDKPASTSASDPVVLKILGTEVKASEIDSIFHELLGSRRLSLNTQGKQHVAELYIRMVVLSQLALNEHLDVRVTCVDEQLPMLVGREVRRA